jgi:TetR/AcrR family transcriptional regulator, tetracycline repressor protein
MESSRRGDEEVGLLMEASGAKVRGRGHPVIDRKAMVEAALGLLDEAGIEGLSMRRLAERLGVKAASLYWHVRNKEELLGLLADEICAEVREPEPDLPWRERLETLVRENRRVLLLHRDAARILAGTVPTGPNRLRLAETMLATLLGAGFSRRDAVRAAFLLTDYATHFVAEEGRFVGGGKAQGSGEAEALARVRRHFESLPEDEYPLAVELAGYLTDPDADGRFEFGLEALLDGLEKKVGSEDSDGEPSG